MDSAAATRTRDTVKEAPGLIKPPTFTPRHHDQESGQNPAVVPGQKDIIVEVELEQRNHQLHHLLRVAHKALLQLFGITNLHGDKQDTQLQHKTHNS